MSLDPPTSTFDPTSGRVRVELEAAEELQAWLDKASRGDFVVRLGDRLEERTQVEVILAASSLEIPMRCLVKQVFRSGRDRYGTMVEWLDRDRQDAAEPEPMVLSPDSTGVASGAFDVVTPQQAAEIEETKPDERWAGERLKLKRNAPSDDRSRLFDISSLNPDDGPSAAPEPSPPIEDPSVSVSAAEQGAAQLEKLLTESGRWSVDELNLDPPAEPASAEPEVNTEPGAAAAAEAVSEPASEQPDPSPEGVSEGRTPEAKQAFRHNETRGVSLAHTISQMNPNEKARLATRASRQERRILLRDHTFSVQMGLLNNPRTETKEIIEIAKNPQTTGGILKRMATDRKFSGNYEIQLALVKHPGTPTPLAIRMLELLRISDLRVLAKSQALRENVRKAALRLYLQRSP